MRAVLPEPGIVIPEAWRTQVGQITLDNLPFIAAPSGLRGGARGAGSLPPPNGRNSSVWTKFHVPPRLE
eukprot:5170698-Prorocentrum_lima.AAC.1